MVGLIYNRFGSKIPVIDRAKLMPKIEILLRAYSAVVLEVTEEDYKDFKENSTISEEIAEKAISQVKDKPEWQFYDAYPSLSEDD